MNGVTVFVLAGGKSSRMGADKAFLSLRGESLLNRALRTASAVAPSVRIVGAPEKFSAYGEVVSDVFTERGPLGGIHAALRSTETEWNVVFAVDMPFVCSDLLLFLVREAVASDCMVTVPRIGGLFQPLCAVYRRGFAQIAEEALIRGCNKIDLLFTSGVTRVIEQAELERLAFPASMFDNLNTREEFDRAIRQGAK